MTARQQPGEIRMVPVNQIEVINPRERNGRIFNEIVLNIKTIGLKKPIVVTPRPQPVALKNTCSCAARGG